MAAKTERKENGKAWPSFNYKLEYLKWFLTLLLSILIYIAIAELIAVLYHPDIQRALDEACKISIIPSDFAPEPKEKLLFVAAVIVFAISITGFYFLAGKYLKRVRKKTIELYYTPCLIISILLLLGVTYLCYTSHNPGLPDPQNKHDADAKTNFDFYFASTFIYNNIYISFFLLFPLVVFNFLYDYNFSTKAYQYINIIKKVFVYCFCSAIIIVTFFTSVFKFPYTMENRFDLNAVYYSVVQVYNGVPLLVDNFTSTYGLYPHFLAPVLKITGLSILSFSTIMALLLAMIFIFIFFFLLKIVKSKVLVLLGFTSLFFVCFMYSHIAQLFDPYFQMYPIRWLFPASLVFYSTYYLNNRSRRNYFLSWIFFSLGILWNPDFGIFTYLALFAFYSYLELANRNLKVIVRKIARHLATALAICASMFLAYSVIIKIFYGSFPDLLKMFSTIKVFSFLGYNMLPIPPGFHPYMLVALTYIIGLIYSAQAVINRKFSNRTSTVFLLTALGIISFTYYQGRSHNWTLFMSNFEVFLLLTIFADDLLLIARKQKTFILPFSVLILFLFFSFFQIIFDYKRITGLMFEKENKINGLEERNRIMQNANFIHSSTKEHEKVLIFPLMTYQGLYHDLSKTCAALNPGLEDLFLRSDYKRLTDYIINNDSTKIFFATREFIYFDTEIPTLLAALYDVQKVEEDNGFLFLTKKPQIINSDYILKQDKEDIIHEKFGDDWTKIVPYMKGEKSKISLGKQFSVEVIFKPSAVPSSPITHSPTLLCNDSNETGLLLQQKDTSSNLYGLVINNRGFPCSVIPGKWNYLAFEVNEKTVKAFSNGQLVKVADINSAYINNNMPLYIGNHKQEGGFFFGDIKEVRIAGGPLNEEDIKLSAGKMKALQ